LSHHRPLFCEHARDVESGNAELGDHDLAETISRLLLQLQRTVELLLRNEVVLDEDRTEQTRSCDSGRFHIPYIGNPSHEV